jgi:hypothetical protein
MKRTTKTKRSGRGGKNGNQKVAFKADYTRMAGTLAKYGFTDEHLGEIFNVSAQTVRNWKKHHPAFAFALKGKVAADGKVEMALFARATGYSHDEVDIRTVAVGGGVSKIVKTPIIKHYPPDTTACIFWLKNRKPSEWRERQEIVGDEGGTVAVKWFLDPEAVNGTAPDRVGGDPAMVKWQLGQETAPGPVPEAKH